MKLLLLSNPNSVHTIKWARSLADNGLDIIIFGLGDFTVNDYNTCIVLDSQSDLSNNSDAKHPLYRFH